MSSSRRGSQQRDHDSTPVGAQPAFEADPRSHRFPGPDGMEWVAVEVETPVSLRNTLPERCLIFSSAVAWRRVCEYPRNWQDLTPSDLWELSWHC